MPTKSEKIKETQRINELVKKYSAAQIEYLVNACKLAANSYFWDGRLTHEHPPCLRRRRAYYTAGEPHGYTAPEQSCVSIARKGGAQVVEKRNSWGGKMTWWKLTREGIEVGLAEYKRMTGADLLKDAAKKKAKHDKEVARERRIVTEIARPFKGIPVSVEASSGKRKRKDLGAHIETTLMGKGTATTVDFDRKMLEGLSRSIDNLRKQK